MNPVLNQSESTNVKLHCRGCHNKDLPYPPTAPKYHYLNYIGLKEAEMGHITELLIINCSNVKIGELFYQ